MKEIIKLHVSLIESKPSIWRELLVHKDTSFFELHHILQIVMGWQNYHLYEFHMEGYSIGELDEGEEGYGSDELLDSYTVCLADVITRAKESISYLYDFGDNWIHQIKVEKFLDIEKDMKYPVCTDGQMRCPPEDCGGIDSYYYYLEVIKDKKHPEYKEIARWIGRKFNPEQFDKEKLNRQLSRLDKYITTWISGRFSSPSFCDYRKTGIGI